MKDEKTAHDLSPHGLSPWRKRIHQVIFEADTPAGKAFDVALLIFIVLSVVTVMLETVPSVRENEAHTDLLLKIEYFFASVFIIEYILRLISVRKPRAYIFSFFGIVDLLSFLPTILGFFLPHEFIVVRILRLLRLFRIFKMVRYMGEATLIMASLRASRPKIIVFIFAVVTLATIMGTLLYLVEGGEGTRFDSIPVSIYWAIVTITTVGYGDISPDTPFGQFLASIGMLAGYAIIAVPTGIVTAEIQKAAQRHTMSLSTRACPGCGKQGHMLDAKYCKYCAEELGSQDS
ncbi:MAG: ion transporter [Verrucomicrobiota bacterium]